jgi:hypothetical protein
MTTNQDVNTPVIAVVGFLGVILVGAVVLLLQVVYYQVEAQQSYDKDLSERPIELSNLLEAQQAQLAEYRRADPAKKVVSIPIGRAIDIVVKELASPDGRTPRTGSSDDDRPPKDNHGAKEHRDAK